MFLHNGPINSCTYLLPFDFSFRLQEDIAESAGKPGHHVNLVQGLTLLVQALSAIPCMFLCGEHSKANRQGGRGSWDVKEKQVSIKKW